MARCAFDDDERLAAFRPKIDLMNLKSNVQSSGKKIIQREEPLQERAFVRIILKSFKRSNTLLPGQISPERRTGPRMSAIECDKGKPYHSASPPLFFRFTKSREGVLDEIAEHFKILALFPLNRAKCYMLRKAGNALCLGFLYV